MAIDPLDSVSSGKQGSAKRGADDARPHDLNVHHGLRFSTACVAILCSAWVNVA